MTGDEVAAVEGSGLKAGSKTPAVSNGGAAVEIAVATGSAEAVEIATAGPPEMGHKVDVNATARIRHVSSPKKFHSATQFFRPLLLPSPCSWNAGFFPWAGRHEACSMWRIAEASAVGLHCPPEGG